jgi:hypothetical protein
MGIERLKTNATRQAMKSRHHIYRAPNWIVRPPLVGVIWSTSFSPWPPRARSSHAVSSSSVSAGAASAVGGRLGIFRMEAKRSLKRRAYSESLAGSSATSGGIVVGCETGISCLARDEYKERATAQVEGALTQMSQHRCAQESRAGVAALLGRAAARCEARRWCHSWAGTGREAGATCPTAARCQNRLYGERHVTHIRLGRPPPTEARRADAHRMRASSCGGCGGFRAGV